MSKPECDIVLVQCPVWGINMPPMSLAYISSYLRKNKVTTAILDLNIEKYHEAHDKSYWINEKAHHWIEKSLYEKICKHLNFDFKKDAIKIAKHNPLAAGFSVTSANRLYALDIIKELKSLDPGIKIILGGKGVFLKEEREFFNGNADFFVIGEGEISTLEIINAIKSKKPGEEFHKIKGICLEDSQGYKPRQVTDLKSLPFPTYEELDLSKYTEKTIGMMLSKGCIADCYFCEDKPFQGYHRTREPKQVFEELSYHVNINKINHFWFNDIAINGNYKALEEMCDLIITNNLDVRWIALAIARKDMSKELILKMKKAGCYTLNFGIESGSDSVLKKMNKFEMFSADDASRVMKDTYEAGINVQPNFIVGFPGETKEEFQETLSFIRKNKENISGITNINTCIAPKRSPIGLLPEKFGIENNSSFHEVEWKQGNLNYEERLKRARETRELARKLGYDIYFSNLSQLETASTNIKERKEVILVICPPWDTKMPPLGIAYLASNLKKQGFCVTVYDLNIEIYNKSPEHFKLMWNMENCKIWTEKNFHKQLFENHWDYLDKIINEMYSKNPLLLGLSTNSMNYNFSCELAKRIKHKDKEIKICIGGPNSEDEYIWSHEIKKYIDFSVIGEADNALPEIVKKIKDNEPLSEIPGVLLFDKAQKVKRAGPIEDLDSLAWPTFLEFDLTKYEEKALPIMGSRGCIAKCSFCLDWMQRNSYKYRSAQNIADELEFHVKTHGINRFNFRDLIINGNLKNLEILCDLIIERNLSIYWCAQGIVNSRMSDRLLEKMRKSGFTNLVFGVESCSDKVLEAMNKPYRVSHLKDLLPRMKKAGIESHINLIIGYPGEGEKEFMETYNFIKENSHYIQRISSLTPCLLLSHTELTENIGKYGIIVPQNENFYSWHTKDKTNTYEIRKHRLKRILELCKTLNIDTPLVNLYDEKMHEAEKILENPKKITTIITSDGKIEHEIKIKPAESKSKLDYLYSAKDNKNNVEPSAIEITPKPNEKIVEEANERKKLHLMQQGSKISELKKINNKNKGILSKLFHLNSMVDTVILGNQESESKHEPLGTWSIKTDSITSCYNGNDNFRSIETPLGKLKKSYWRDFADWAGIRLNLYGINNKDLIMKIKVYDDSYNQGNSGELTKVSVSHDGKEWFTIGYFRISGMEKWVAFSFTINKNLVRGEKLYMKMDDKLNLEKGGFGKRIGSISLFR